MEEAVMEQVLPQLEQARQVPGLLLQKAIAALRWQIPIHLQHDGATLLQLQVLQIVPEAICKTLQPIERMPYNPGLPILGTPAEIQIIQLPTGQRVAVPIPGQVPIELPTAGIILLRGRVIHQHTASQGLPISPAIIAARQPGVAVH